MQKSKREMLESPALTEDQLYNHSFIGQYFTEVSPAEADKMYPLTDHAALAKQGYHFFRCDFFNTSTRKCDAHNLRPPLCRGFPWYGKKADGVNILGYPMCSYWEDVSESERPAAVQVFISSKRPSVAS